MRHISSQNITLEKVVRLEMSSVTRLKQDQIGTSCVTGSKMKSQEAQIKLFFSKLHIMCI